MTRDEGRALLREPALLLFVVGVAGLTIFRWTMANSLPLWLDESFTAVVTGQPDWQSFLRQLWLDPSAPLYAVLMWLWPWHGDVGLRLPGLILMLATAILPLLWRIPRLSNAAACTWGLLLFSWTEGIAFSFDARPYALLLLLATAQTIAFARLLDQPSLRRAMGWTVIAALAILTHYFAAVLGLVQGLILLAVQRRAALSLWPALLPLAIPAAVLGWHYPRLAEFAAPGTAWYAVYTGKQLIGLTLALFGDQWPLMVGTAVLGRFLLPKTATTPGRIAALAALSGIVAIVLLAVCGTLRPMLAGRYLTPGVPGLLLALLLLARHPFAQLLLGGASLLTTTAQAETRALDRANNSLERATTALLAQAPPPRRLVYSLGFAGQPVLNPTTSKQLGELAFARRGLTTPAAIVPTIHAAPLEAAAGRDGAIIWIYQQDAVAEAAALGRRRHCISLPRSVGGTLACPALDRPN